MRERGLEFKVGLLVLVSVVILGGFIAVLGNFSPRSGFKVYLDFNYVGSLHAGAPVRVAGIKVGRVKDVEFIGGLVDDRLGKRVQVRVTAWIEDRAHESIRQDAEFFINTAGVLGEQYLEIVPGKDWERSAIAENTVIHDDPTSSSVRVHDPPRTDLMIARLNEVLDGVSQVLRTDGGSIKSLLSGGADAVAALNELLTQNRVEIRSLIAEGAGLAKEARIALGKVNAGLGSGQSIATLLADADTALRTAQQTMTRLTPPAEALMTDATRVSGLVTEQRIERALVAADQAAVAAGNASALIGNANGLVTDLRAGKGAAGALLARDELYSDLREMVRDLKRNPWKLIWKE